MAASTEPPSRLLSLPSELRVRILHAYLAGWDIPVDCWTNSLNETLPLLHLGYGLDTLKTFHINRQIREEATPLIATCATLCFLSGPRGPWDRRWRTAGTPLPHLLRENVRRVQLQMRTLTEHYVVPLGELPRLREVRVLALVARIDRWGSRWSRDWRDYQEFPESEEKEETFFEGKTEDSHRWWVDEMLKTGDWAFRVFFQHVVLFPDIVGEEVRTVRFTYTIDARTREMVSRSFEQVGDLWPEESQTQRGWTIPFKELWRLGDNSKLNDVVV